MNDVFWHGSIDFTGELDEEGVLAVFPRFPREIERVDGDAVSTQPRTGIKWHEAEGFGLRCVDDLPNIDSHGFVDDLQLVHQGDIDAAESIFEQLGGFGD